MSRVNVCFVVVVLISSIYSQSVSGEGCSLNIKKDLPSNAPVFVDKNHNLVSPLGPVLEWKVGERVGIICSGNKNELTSTNQRETILECGRNGLHQNGTAFPSLQCSRDNVADVIEKRKACINGGTIKHIGFRTHATDFVKYLEVCYNMKSATVVYTHHTIPGKAINYRIEKNSRPFFSPVGSPGIAKASWVYSRKSQIKTLTPVLGEKQVQKYFNDTSYLSRGHLSPDADGVFKSWQLATYFYINVAPQWQSVNGENWVAVEKLARRKAAKIKDDLEIYTGVSGIMSLPNASGKNVPLYLRYETRTPMIPVPKWYWKILKYKNEGIAFVTLNNPFATKKEYICPDICEKFNWPNTEFDLFNKGFTYCCKVSDLIKSLPDVPPEAFVQNIMSY